MISSTDLDNASWRKSSYSNGDGGACLEVADLPGAVPVRDSKVPGGAVLLLQDRAWAAFVAAVKTGAVRRQR